MEKIHLQHINEVAKLNKLEKHLIGLIANIGNKILRDKFLEWQDQRNKCNSVYNEWLKDLFVEKNK